MGAAYSQQRPWLALLASAALAAGSHALGEESSERAEGVTVRGRVVCLNASGERLRQCPKGNGPMRFAIRSADGSLHPLSAGDPRTVTLTDPRVRALELEIVGWPDSENRLEIVKLYAVRHGRLHDIHYRCETCNITAYTPGLCWCCQKEFEFREVPLEKH